MLPQAPPWLVRLGWLADIHWSRASHPFTSSSRRKKKVLTPHFTWMFKSHPIILDIGPAALTLEGAGGAGGQRGTGGESEEMSVHIRVCSTLRDTRQFLIFHFKKLRNNNRVSSSSVKILGSNIVNCINNPIWNLRPNSQLISSIQLLPPLNMLFFDDQLWAKVASGQTLKSKSK